MTGLAGLVRRRQSLCAGVAAALPAYVAGEAPLDPRTADHVEHCLRCQAEVARYRRMLRTLHALREESAEPPPAVLTSILNGLEPGRDRRGPGVRAAVVAGVAVVAAVAGGAGTIVWLARRRAPLTT